MKPAIPSKGLEWTNLVLGGLLFSSAFLFGAFPAAAWNAAVVGAVVVCCATANLYRFDKKMEWYIAGLGSWAVIAPFLLGFDAEPVPVMTHLILGISIATIAALQLRSGRRNLDVLPAPVRIRSTGKR